MPYINRTQALQFPCRRNINFCLFRTLNHQKLHYPLDESLEHLRRPARWKIDCCNFCLRMNVSYRIPDQDLSIGHSRLPSSPGVIQNCYKSHHLCSLIRVLCHSLRNLFGCLSCWYEVLFWCPSSLVAFFFSEILFHLVVSSPFFGFLVNALNWYFLWYAGL